MKRIHLALLAVAVGLIYSFPNVWWYFTLPNYSVVRGYILSDNDLLPYASALTDSAYGLPPTTHFLGSYENRHQFYSVPLSYWVTNLLLGNLMRLVGSLEALAAAGLFLSGAATFLLMYVLGRALLPGRWAALIATLLACFRYPFYVGLVAAARQLVASGGRADWQPILGIMFPGMVNGWQLYPYIRWPLPSMMFWWFLAGLILSLRLLRHLAYPNDQQSHARLAVGLGVLAGLTAYVYVYFWIYLGALFCVLAAVGGLAGNRRLLIAMGTAALITILMGAPLAVWQHAADVPMVTAVTRRLQGPTPRLGAGDVWAGTLDAWMEALAVHGMLALGVWLAVARDISLPAKPAERGHSSLQRIGWSLSQYARQALKEPEAAWLFCLHGTVVLLGVGDLAGVNFEFWHWPKYLMDNLTPLAAAWIVLRLATKRRSAQVTRAAPARRVIASWAAWAALCFASCLALWAANITEFMPAFTAGVGLGVVVPALSLSGRLSPRLALGVGALVSAFAGLFFHRTINEMSWVALLPLTVGLAGLSLRYARAAALAFTSLNVLLAATLQLAVRPVMARDFYTIRPEYVEALNWLNQYGEPDSVVVTNGWTNDYLIRAYTRELTLSAADWWSGYDYDPRAERFLIRTAIFRVRPKDMNQLLANQGEAVRQFKANVNLYWIGGEAMDILSEEQGIVRWYNLKDYAPLYVMPLSDLLHLYQTDYIWVGPWERKMGQRDFANSPVVVLVFDNGLVQIYQVNDEAREAQADGRHSQ